MEASRVGSVCRALRIRRRWRQSDLAATAHVSRGDVSRLERGCVGELRLDDALRIFVALGARLDLVPRWQGGELDRLLNARHSAMHDSVARYLVSQDGWQFAPEVSFSIRGERGIIDILAWHPATRTVLVIELKTEIVHINELMGTIDRKRRAGRRDCTRAWMACGQGRGMGHRCRRRHEQAACGGTPKHAARRLSGRRPTDRRLAPKT